MVIHIYSIGKTNVAFVQDGLKEYLKRLQHYCKLNWVELPDVRKVDRNDQAALKKAEGNAFLEQINATWRVVLLDDKGKQQSSEGFAQWLNEHMLYQQQDLCFIIGGAYGFSDELIQRSNASLSLSRMTFNHQMVRMIFAEQLYRSFTIIRGEPYHHA